MLLILHYILHAFKNLSAHLGSLGSLGTNSSSQYLEPGFYMII